MMAIRKSAYDAVGGFPPDTIGVETNSAKKTFKKLYIGPGDFGLCFLCKKAGYKIIYSPKMCVFHVIPPIRITREFWVSRMVGEGHCNAISKNILPGFPVNGWIFNTKKLFSYYFKSKMKKIGKSKNVLIPEEIWFEYYKSLIGMSWVLFKNPKLAKYLWRLGKNGVLDEDFDAVITNFPKAYQQLALK